MVSHQSRPTAKIYQFPPRAAAAGRKMQEQRVVDPRFQHAVGVEFGSGWYHEAAMREADLGRKA